MKEVSRRCCSRSFVFITLNLQAPIDSCTMQQSSLPAKSGGVGSRGAGTRGNSYLQEISGPMWSQFMKKHVQVLRSKEAKEVVLLKKDAAHPTSRTKVTNQYAGPRVVCLVCSHAFGCTESTVNTKIASHFLASSACGVARCIGYLVDQGGELGGRTPPDVLADLARIGSSAAKRRLADMQQSEEQYGSASKRRQTCLEAHSIRPVSTDRQQSFMEARALFILMTPNASYALCENPWLLDYEKQAGIPPGYCFGRTM